METEEISTEDEKKALKATKNKKGNRIRKYEMWRRWSNTNSGKYISLLISRMELISREVEYAIRRLNKKRKTLFEPTVLE